MKTLLQLSNDFYSKFQESSTNTRYTPTKVKEWINEGYVEALEILGLDDLRRETVMQNFYITVSSAGTSTGTSLYVVSAAVLQPGQWLYVWDSSNCEKVRVASISGNTVTLVSPGLTNTYILGDFVASNQIWVPSNFARMETLCVYGGELDGSASLFPDTLQHSGIRTGGIPIVGDPTGYMPGEIDMTKLPSSGMYNCGLSTITTSVDCSALPAIDNLFVDWLFINTTRSAVARVTAYNSSTKVLTLGSTITSQAPGDGFVLEKRLNSLYLNRIPDDVYSYRLAYLANTSYMMNDYDVPIFREAYHKYLVDYALAQAYIANPFGDKSAGYAMEQRFVRKMQEMKDRLEAPDDGSLCWNTVETVENEDLTFWG